MVEQDIIQASDLVRTFGRVRALDGLTLDLREREIFGLVGPNGAGKTTFIRIVVGLLRPTSGRISVFGGGPSDPEVSARVGYMTQSPALYEDLTVHDNLVFFARLYDLPKGEARAQARELEDLMALSAKRTTPVRELSGGMRQLTNLACAMVHHPPLLLLDEPTVGVDPALRRRLWGHFAALNAEGTTIVLTTHVMEEAERCQRVALISSGRVIALGTPEELRRRAGARSLEEAYLSFGATGVDERVTLGGRGDDAG